MKPHLFCLFLFMGIASGLSAQNIRVSGRVTDAEKQPIDYANVSLLRLDSTFVTGCTTGKGGKFVLKDLQSDNYLLQVSFVGYATQCLRLDNVDRALDVGEIVLTDDAVLLEGVTVTASNVVRKLDRQIVLPTSSRCRPPTAATNCWHTCSCRD